MTESNSSIVLPQGKKLLDQYRDAIRMRHYSSRTEKTYLHWIREYIYFHNKKHPREMGIAEINQFLAHLVTDKKISASTQNQALSAILFLYRHVLHVELDEASLAEFRPQQSKTIPTVLSKEEAKLVIGKLTGVYKILAQLMYGGGLRVMETLRLRVKDIDFANHQVIVRDGKGDNDRVTILPDGVVQVLQLHLRQTKIIHEKDLAEGFGSVYLPFALERKSPNASREWIWQYVFPASTLFMEAATGIKRRHHLHETAVQRAVREAARLAKINKHVTPHTFRHSFATHLLQNAMIFAPCRNYWGTRM
jgi:integron integrase